MSDVRVVVVDDQPVVRAGLIAMLQTDARLEVVGEAADGSAALGVIEATSPDVVLMDIRMPVLDGISATRQLLAGAGDSIRVVVLTTFDLDEYVFEALNAGASAFLLKDADPESIVSAVHAVAAGHTLVAPDLTRRLVARWTVPQSTESEVLSSLTARELDVLTLVARGLTNREIARELTVEESTVKTHVGRLLAKMQARDRVHLVIQAYAAGLV